MRSCFDPTVEMLVKGDARLRYIKYKDKIESIDIDGY